MDQEWGCSKEEFSKSFETKFLPPLPSVNSNKTEVVRLGQVRQTVFQGILSRAPSRGSVASRKWVFWGVGTACRGGAGLQMPPAVLARETWLRVLLHTHSCVSFGGDCWPQGVLAFMT